jgi:hypothetical protein
LIIWNLQLNFLFTGQCTNASKRYSKCISNRSSNFCLSSYSSHCSKSDRCSSVSYIYDFLANNKIARVICLYLEAACRLVIWRVLGKADLKYQPGHQYLVRNLYFVWGSSCHRAWSCRRETELIQAI